MPMIEDPERIKSIENEMAHTWTRYRHEDVCRIIKDETPDQDFLNKLITIKFPYYFPVDGEQAYISKEYPYPFKESELEFVKQKLY